MPIDLKCERCQRRFQAPDAALGTTAACPNCGDQVTVKPLSELRRKAEPASPVAKKDQDEEYSTNADLMTFSTVAAIATASIVLIGPLVFTANKVTRNSSPQPSAQVASPPPSPEGVNPAPPTVLYQGLGTGHAETGLGLSLEQFKRSLPANGEWQVTTNTEHEDGTVSYAMNSTSKTGINMSALAHGNPNHLSQLSFELRIKADKTRNTPEYTRAIGLSATQLAHFFSAHSHWTEEELIAFWTRLMKIGSRAKSEVRIQKNGHECWANPINVSDGFFIAAGVTAEPNSTAPTLQSWLENHPLPPYKTGESFRVGYTSYCVRRAWWSNHLSNNRFLNEPPNASYLFIEIAVRNDDTKARMIPPFTLIDQYGAEYETSSAAFAVEGNIGPLESLNPGVTKEGTIVFDVPKKIYTLKVSGGFWSGEDALIGITAR